jgi:hypothetical protein
MSVEFNACDIMIIYLRDALSHTSVRVGRAFSDFTEENLSAKECRLTVDSSIQKNFKTSERFYADDESLKSELHSAYSLELLLSCRNASLLDQAATALCDALYSPDAEVFFYSYCCTLGTGSMLFKRHAESYGGFETLHSFSVSLTLAARRQVVQSCNSWHYTKGPEIIQEA